MTFNGTVAGPSVRDLAETLLRREVQALAEGDHEELRGRVARTLERAVEFLHRFPGAVVSEREGAVMYGDAG